MGAVLPQLPCYLAEWYRSEVTSQPVDDIAAQLNAGAAMLYAEDTPVRLLVAVVVATDEVLYGLFAAHSPEIVIQACTQAGIPADRLSAGVAARMADSSVSATIPRPARDADSLATRRDHHGSRRAVRDFIRHTNRS